MTQNPQAGSIRTSFYGLLDGLAYICKIITGVSLVVLTLIFGWLVFGRYVMNDTPTWVEQVSLLLVMVITFLGAAVGIHEHTHLGVSYFREVVPDRVKTVFTVLTHITLLVFGIIMATQSFKLTVFKWGSEIPLLHVPEGLRSTPITICGVLICLFTFGHLLRMICGDPEVEDHDE
jgi:TRAP-type C4-dicarboxylate transport system permease small subunit